MSDTPTPSLAAASLGGAARVRRALVMLLAGIVAAAGGLAAAAEQAQAYDAKPCFKKRGDAKRKFRWAGHTYPPTPIRYCPLWRDRVPVRASRSGRAPIVGYLNVGGTANWFVYQMRGDRQTLPTSPPVWNRWWASTKADNGRWGWVNEVFFSGGDNGEPDRGLTGPPGKWVCVAPCPPIPPWAT